MARMPRMARTPRMARWLADYPDPLHTMARYNGKCPLCGFSLDTESLGFLRHGHAARISLSCAAGHSLRWFSSSVISGKFTVNLRYVTYLVNFDEVDTNFINQVLVEQKI